MNAVDVQVLRLPHGDGLPLPAYQSAHAAGLDLLSKLRQAEYRRQQADVELSQAQREALSNLYSFYNEAVVSRSEVQGLREAAELAAEMARISVARCQSGEPAASLCCASVAKWPAAGKSPVA